MSGEPCWDSSIPPAPRPCYDVLNPRYDQRLKGYVISDRIQGVWMHYVRPRTTPCTRESGRCDACSARLKRYWKGFLYVWTDRDRPVAIFELTATAAERYHRRLCGQGAPIRGCAIAVYRADGRPGGRVVCDLADLPKPGVPLPDLPDIKWALARMWNAPTRGVEAPAPPPVDDDAHEPIPFPGAKSM